MRRALDFPRRINVELTNHCNQRCKYCPRSGFTRSLGFMDPDLFQGTLKMVGRTGDCFVATYAQLVSLSRMIIQWEI